MGTNEKETTQVVTSSSVDTSSSAQIVEKIARKRAEKPSYKAPKIREIDPTGVLYAMFN